MASSSRRGDRPSDPPPSGILRTATESGRVEAFSDGVLAIAITLLVLDLHPGHHPGEMGRDLLQQWPSYIAYVASFIYIGVVWVNHHSLFTRIAQVDAGLLWSNLALLLAASVLPFPTAELAFAMGSGTHADQLSALVLYAIVSSAMGLTWLLIFTYLHSRPWLLRAEVPAGFFSSERRRAVFGIFTPAIPVALGLWSPPIALLSMLAMPIFYVLTANGLGSGRR